MLRTWKILLILFFVLKLLSCTEIWDGNVKPAESVLVVNALISDHPGDQSVRLYSTVGYGQSPRHDPETDAVVFVEDEAGAKWYFSEISPGHYVSSDLLVKNGSIYTLVVELQDGSIYKSVPQSLQEVQPLDTIIARDANVLLDVYDHDLELVPEWVQGVELYTDIDMAEGFAKRIRFESEVMFQYDVILNNQLICLQYLPGNFQVCNNIDPQDPPRMNCRTRLPLNDVVNLTMPGMDLPVGQVYRHNLGFAPRDRRYYNLTFPGTLNRRILITTQYAITDEAFRFFQQVREQMLAEDAIFDPVPSQITGNMRSISHPERIVLGLFEVAGKKSQTFIMSHEPWNTENVSLREINDLSFLPGHKCYYESFPDHWIFH